ncbi:hypothetical protein BaRGS_00013309 [Batillaria attramentaria]|uniref:Uncharacterized protein n=1 Tax=Batillaria attramentaria TaxID=370345 RepID=A0ABD0L880_9CAEN
MPLTFRNVDVQMLLFSARMASVSSTGNPGRSRCYERIPALGTEPPRPSDVQIMTVSRLSKRSEQLATADLKDISLHVFKSRVNYVQAPPLSRPLLN